MQVYLKDITRLVFLQCLFHIAAIGFTHCPFHLVVYVWTTRRSELQLDCVLKLGFVSLISDHAAPRLVQKALTASPADVVQAERLVITP